jgi:hypothetical protein
MGETAFYPFLSGQDNLRAAARRCQVPDAQVEAVLDVAGLAARAADRVSELPRLPTGQPTAQFLLAPCRRFWARSCCRSSEECPDGRALDVAAF